MMNSSTFLGEIRTMAVRSAGQNNINATKMRNMLIPVPPLKDQKRFVKVVEEQESRITAAEAVIAATPARKAAILKKHL
jgi:restriction endonuclease S subunit